jgi:hypothetical protein
MVAISLIASSQSPPSKSLDAMKESPGANGTEIPLHLTREPAFPLKAELLTLITHMDWTSVYLVELSNLGQIIVDGAKGIINHCGGCNTGVKTLTLKLRHAQVVPDLKFQVMWRAPRQRFLLEAHQNNPGG